MNRIIWITLCCLALGLGGCKPEQAATASPTAAPPSAISQPGLPALPPEPQRIEFASEDGAILVGLYYPAAVNPAPLVVLMHWAQGDKNDWVALGMAAWLQNRGLEVPASPATLRFDTPYPFTPLPAATDLGSPLSFGVFVFDFRDYGESAPSNLSFSQLRPLWVMDARAAYAQARTLPGADAERIVGIGASIGADAVVDACGEGCLGALSLGPGSYLEIPYAEAVRSLDALGKPVWCVGANDDSPAMQACRSASGTDYRQQIYPAGGHAMQLFQVSHGLQPPIDALILDFLRQVYGLEQ